MLCLGAGGGCNRANDDSVPIETGITISGETLFKAKSCRSCHTIGEGDKVGPDLKGLFVRRDEAWVRRYLADPIAMVANDPVAAALKEKYRVQMPRFLLSQTEINALIDYLRVHTSDEKMCPLR